jgi:hypothetical protein
MRTDRNERFELRLTAEESRELRVLATETGMSGADYLRQLLRQTWAKEKRRSDQQKLETLAFVTLNEMTSRPGIASVAVFTSPPGASRLPGSRLDAGPQPAASSILEVPMLGTVVAQAFTWSLSDHEKALVEARFPGQLATWALVPRPSASPEPPSQG